MHSLKNYSATWHRHILCPEWYIALLRDPCQAHRSKIMTEGSDDLSVKIITNFLIHFTVH